MNRLNRVVFMGAFLVLAGVSVQARVNVAAAEMIGRYFDLLSDNNLAVAGDMWVPEAIERANRFGINYTGIPLRVDAISPIIRYLALKQTQPILPIRDFKTLPGNTWVKMEYSEIYGAQLLSHYYYARQIGDWYWLDYPQDYYGADWPVTESRYLRIHAHPDVQRFLNPAVLNEVDAFIEAMADTLRIPADRLELIRDKKIEYFYCQNDSSVRDITGFLSKGQLDLASNDIISSVFPHFHELTHLLVNIRLQNVPLFTLPLLREGMAVRFGGRASKEAPMLLDLATYLGREGLVALDSLLTMKGFDSEATAEIVYPESGLFTAYLLDKIGMDRYFDLYLRLSGQYDEVQALTTDTTKAAILAATGVKNWDKLLAEFVKFSDKRLDHDQGLMPGPLKKGKTVFTDDRVTIATDKNWVSFHLVYDTTMRAPSGCLMFDRDSILVDHESALFDAHYGPIEQFEGYRYGLRFDSHEAGLYDYASNELIAKYIWGITPSDQYLDTTAHTVSLCVRRSLMHDHLPAEGDYNFLPW